MKKIIAAVLAAATFTSAFSMAAFAAPIKIDSSHFKLSTLNIQDFDVIVAEKSNLVGDVVTPGKSIFIAIDDINTPFGSDTTNKDYFTYKVKATEGAKHVASYNYFVGKKDLDISTLQETYKGVLSGRYSFIEIKLKDNFTDAENKIRLQLDIKGKKKYTGSASFTSEYIYVGNKVENGTDLDIAAGTGGKIFKPTKNEENQIIWNDDIRDIARLTFIADSDVAKTYPKLNTKWTESDYADYFANQDAFLFEFVSNSYVASTSRATLELYNPYYNTDTDVVTVDPANVIIYQVTADGLVNVTEQFKHGENDDGDMVFTVKTRQLGTYIFAEAEATMGDVVGGDDIIEAPVETIKKPVDTGR